MLVVFKDGSTVTFNRTGCEIYITDYLLVFSQNDDFTNTIGTILTTSNR